VAAVVGAALAVFLVRLLVAVAPAATPRLDEVRVDAAALLFALGAAGACGLAFGALPALQATSVDGQALVIRSRAGVTRTHRLRRGLMIVEVALALVLLIGGGLMARTLLRLTAVDAGFNPDRLLTMHFSLEGPRWNRQTRLAL